MKQLEGAPAESGYKPKLFLTRREYLLSLTTLIGSVAAIGLSGSIDNSQTSTPSVNQDSYDSLRFSPSRLLRVIGITGVVVIPYVLGVDGLNRLFRAAGFIKE